MSCIILRDSYILAIVSAQVSVLVIKDVKHQERIKSSFISIIGLWLGVLLYSSVSNSVYLTLAITPFILSFGILSQGFKFNLGVAGFSISWVWLFSNYYAISEDLLVWHLASVTIGMLSFMLVRFIIWTENKTLNHRDLVNIYRNKLAEFSLRSPDRKSLTEDESYQHIQKLGEEIQIILSALSTGKGISPDLSNALIDLRLAVEYLTLSPINKSKRSRLKIAATLRRGKPSRNTKLLYVNSALSDINRFLDQQDRGGTVSFTNEKKIIDKKSVLNRTLQVFLASGSAAYLGFFISEDRWIWAVVTALLLFIRIESSGHTVQKGIKNIVGAFLGVIAGVLLIEIIGSHLVLEFIFTLILLFLSLYYQQVFYSLSIACLTAALGLSFSLIGESVTALLEIRLLEVVVGTVCGVLVGKLIMPMSTQKNINNTTLAFLKSSADAIKYRKNYMLPQAFRDNYNELLDALSPTKSPFILTDRNRVRALMIQVSKLQHLIELLNLCLKINGATKCQNDCLAILHQNYIDLSNSELSQATVDISPLMNETDPISKIITELVSNHKKLSDYLL